MIWHTELRAMKAVVAGEVAANCGEANLTCGPLPTCFAFMPPPPLHPPKCTVWNGCL